MNRRTPVIGLHGMPRAGKDTLANFLVERHGFMRLAFADKLYREVSHAFTVREEDLRSDDWKKNPRPELALHHCLDVDFFNLMMSHGHDALEPRTSRWIAQRWGTEYRRAQDPRYWIRPIEHHLFASAGKPLVLTDIRFVDEAECPVLSVVRGVRSAYRLVEITSTRAESFSHVSDSRLPSRLIDLTLANNGTPEDLYQQAIDKLGHLL